MNLHRLEITGIGPFAGTETVDFDRLGETGVYLLTGRTGSGKTTVLDAVSYAIFGKVPRNTDGGDVVSHHRRLETTPRVVLEATIGEDRVRITRSPRHERPARKGGGTTTEGQSLLVERHSGGAWEAVTGKWSEGDAELKERVGMTAAQFNQVVVLPQGEFSRFLDSSANDRRELLRRLFPDTDLEWLERWLHNEAVEARRRHDEKLAEIGNRFHGVRPIALELAGGGDEEGILPDHALREEALEWIEVTGRRLDSVAAEAETARLAASDAWDAASRELQRLTGRAELVRKRKAAGEELAGLEAREAWRRETGERIAAADRASPVQAVAATAAARERERELAAAGLDRLKPILGAAPLTAGIPVSGYGGRRQELRDEAVRIDEFIRTGLPRREEVETGIDRVAGELKSLGESGPESAMGRAVRRVEETAESALEAGRQYLEIRTARNHGMALALAADLKEGVPCPVCGSRDHPAPPEGSGEFPSEDDEKRAGKAHSAANLAETEARRALAETESRIATERATAETRLAALQAELDQLIARESELSADAPGAAERLEQVEAAIARLDGFLKMAEDLRASGASAETARTEASAKAMEQGFESVEAALASAVAPAELEGLKSDVRKFDQQLSIVRNALAGELDGVDPAEVVDLGTATSAEKEAAAVRDRLTAAAGHSGRQVRTFRKETDPVAGLYRELAPLEQAANRAGELDRMASGNNARRMRLSIFVLAARLQQVIEAANSHLSKMTDQRYSLVYSSDLAGHGAASGLGIDVLDAYTSESRPTGTLSGGEKFCAALSLALGLAEVVQVEASGKSLDTLFIDEGFGTLDAKSLDQVMSVIDSLREGGRSVGLVSHVEEMRDRITAQIRVTGGRDGSTLKVTTG